MGELVVHKRENKTKDKKEGLTKISTKNDRDSNT